jgi:hypothetical protein
MYKLRAVITAVGLGIVGLVVWVWFANYPAGRTPMGEPVLVRATMIATVCVGPATAASCSCYLTALWCGWQPGTTK